MTSDKRTLPEELNSVLLEHSLHAPEPGPTIERVLARVTAEAAPAANRSPWIRARRFASGRSGAVWLGAAAAVGLLAVGITYLPSHSSSSSKASSTTAGLAEGALGANAPAAGSSAASATSSAPSCQPDTVIAPTTMTVRGTIVSVRSYLCVTGGVATSLVQVTAGGAAQTLIDPSQGLRVESITADENSVKVAALAAVDVADSVRQPPLPTSDQTAPVSAAAPNAAASGTGVGDAGSAPAPAALPGSVQQYVFPSSGNLSFGRPSVTLVAGPCVQSGLRVTVAAVHPASQATRPGGSVAAIAVVNDTANLCAISGFPTVEAVSGSVHIGAKQTLVGAGGGVKSSAPPVVVLAPGGRATAILESANGSCATATALEVSLPKIGPVGRFGYPIGVCGLQVHPLVSGS